MKIWQKPTSKKTHLEIENFTVGKDRDLDIHLAPFDVLGSIAHGLMLEKIGLLTKEESKLLVEKLKEIYFTQIEAKTFVLEEGVEDVHSQIEQILISSLGDIGKKIHSGRSRNDQVLVDLKMYMRAKVEDIVTSTNSLFTTLINKSEAYKNDLLPGYTHLQVAMPSSFGLWFGAYAESLIDDLEVLKSAYKVINKNPLGSGAGYGSSFPLDRDFTTELLGFNQANINVVYAQMTRGKVENILVSAIATIAGTLGKLAMDVCLYNSQNFNFIILPEECTTGSSIMPHKKNPDVAEILRGKANKLKAIPTEIAFITSNLPSGYHRDLQITKELLIPAIEELEECLSICNFMLGQIKIRKDILNDPKYDLLFSVENVNDLVNKGETFREAYRIVGDQVNNGEFKPLRDLNHTLLGSIGNLGNNRLEQQMQSLINSFNFSKTQEAYTKLLGK